MQQKFQHNSFYIIPYVVANSSMFRNNDLNVCDISSVFDKYRIIVKYNIRSKPFLLWLRKVLKEEKYLFNTYIEDGLFCITFSVPAPYIYKAEWFSKIGITDVPKNDIIKAFNYYNDIQHFAIL